jgi:hypothetical protein
MDRRVWELVAISVLSAFCGGLALALDHRLRRDDCMAGLRGLELRNDGPKYRFEMSRGFSSDSAESGYQRLFAHELQKSDMHPTPWLACDCMPGMKDSKLVSAHDFWKSEREPAEKRLRSGVPELSGYLRRSP